MEKIQIRNFGAISNADIEVRNVLVLIGEQASGKSTIAKLIYFFKTLGDVFFKSLYNADRDVFNGTDDLKLPMRTRFYDLFGSTFHLPDFEIIYQYDVAANRKIRLYLNDDKKLMTELSPKFVSSELIQSINLNKKLTRELEKKLTQSANPREKVTIESDRLKAIHRMSEAINKVFETRHNSQLYMIAGREATISYEVAFQAYLEKVLTEQIEENRKLSEELVRSMVDETLMIDYIKETRKIKEDFNKYGGTFESVISQLKGGYLTPEEIAKKVKLILKGEYYYDRWGEKIQFANGQYVHLKDASSGQKEVIRILQDILFCILYDRITLRVIEEPEAHLFPVAQKQLIELMVTMKNVVQDNQLIITTHSPYVLSVINNLLFAHKVAINNASVNDRIPNNCHINPTEFSAYSLGNSLVPSSNYCEDIVDRETNVIKQNYLDTVSDILADDFNFLYSLYATELENTNG